MRCPHCGNENTQVKDSRRSDDGNTVRRRRECPDCEARFTTFERIEVSELMVIKRSGRRLPFDRDKLVRSISIATIKRDINSEAIEKLVDDILLGLENKGETEVPTSQLGIMVMEALKKLDIVAFVRFASVYRDFKSIDDFGMFLADLSEPEK